jgi:hypothetical protein
MKAWRSCGASSSCCLGSFVQYLSRVLFSYISSLYRLL